MGEFVGYISVSLLMTLVKDLKPDRMSSELVAVAP